MMKKLLLIIIVFATSISYGQDALSWTPGDFPQAPTASFQFTYTSDVDIAIGGIKLDMWSISSPYSGAWRHFGQNWAILPAGTNLTTTIVVNPPANNAIMNTNGSIMSKQELIAANPNSATNPTNYYYEFRLTTPDTDFNPTITGGTTGYASAIPGPTASVKDYEALKVGVYPNPTSDFISIENVDKDIKSVKIYDVTGKEVKAFNGHLNLNVSSLQPGLYLIKTDTGRLSKFIKQ